MNFTSPLPRWTAIFACALICAPAQARKPRKPTQPAPKPIPPLAGISPPIALGYYPGWTDEPAPAQLHYERYTHLVHAFAKVDGQGKLRGEENVPSPELVRLAHKAGTKVLLGLGGGSNGKNFGRMARDTALRGAFVADVQKMVRDTGYDGVDLDWEYPLQGETEYLTLLTRDLATSLRAANKNALVTMAVSRGNYYGQWLDVASLAPLLDWFNVMTYDQHGPWSAAGHNDALMPSPAGIGGDTSPGIAQAIAYWQARGLQKKKILVGLAGYGRGFKVANWGEKATVASANAEVSFRQIPALIAAGWTRNWDGYAATPWLVSADGTERISYDDEQSTKIKAAWARDAGLPGYFFWDVEQDWTGGEHTLAVAARAGWDTPLASLWKLPVTSP